MWIFQSIGDPGQSFRLLCGREYSIGRRDCDILIENDMSISRKHATISVSHPDNQVVNPQRLPILTLTDLSRLGTLVGETRVIKDKCVVSEGSVMVFGTAGISRYRAKYESYLTTTSCLDVPGKKKTRQLIGQLGGHVTNEWRQNCKLLIMNTLSITIKAICAMITQRPIVTPDYLEDLVKSIDTNKQQPKSEDYLPPLAESQLDPTQVSFKPDPRRATVFQGNVFIFLNAKQFKKLSIAVELGRGTPMLMEEGSDDNEDDILVMPGSCVMSCELIDQSQNISKNAHDWIQHVMGVLKKHRKRPIQECEIGYAVLYVSVKTHCNPNVQNSMAGGCVPVVPQTLSQVDMTASQLRAPDTQNRENQSERPADRKPAAKIKVEPPSQKHSSEMTREFTSSSTVPGKKRARESDDYDQDNTATKRTAVANARGSVTKVKEEPITPQKVATVNNNIVNKDTFDVPVRGGSGINRKSRSPSPNPAIPRIVSPRSKRGVDLDFFDSELTTNSRRTRRSPSPRPESPRNLQPKSRPSPEEKTKKGGLFSRKNIAKRRHVDSDDDDDDNMPGKKLRVKQESSGFARRERSPELLSDEHQALDSDGEVDMFSMVPTRKGRSQVEKGQSQAGNSAPKRERKSLSPSRERKVQRVKHEAKDASDSDDLRIPETAEDERLKPSTSRGQPQRVQPQDAGYSPSLNSRPKIEPMGQVDVSMFPKSDYEFDPNLPTNVMVVEERDLIVRKPTQRRHETQGDTCMWKGKLVKNYKRFRKTANAGSSDLPLVIGGKDLVVDNGSVSKALQDWFDECIAEEKRKDQQERDDDELFNFSMKKALTKGRQATKGRKR